MPEALNTAYGVLIALCLIVPAWVAYSNGGRR